MVKVPLPAVVDWAIGMVSQPAPRVCARSARPSLLESPTEVGRLPSRAQPANSGDVVLVIPNVPFRFDVASGIVSQPGPPTSAMSDAPSLLKSPAIGLAPSVRAHAAQSGALPLAIVKVPLPAVVDNATGI